MESGTVVEEMQSINFALDACGVIGSEFRDQVARGVLSGLLLRQGGDPLHVHGASGTGKGLVADVIHNLAVGKLGRTGGRVNLDCGSVAPQAFPEALKSAAEAAEAGTLVLDRMEALNADGLTRVARLQKTRGDLLLVGLAETPTGLTGARLRLKPLHEREDDLFGLVDYYFERAARELPSHECRGFSRQSKADISAAVRETSISSVATLRDIVRDCVFEAAASGALPDRLTSEGVRSVLEARYGQAPADRVERDIALLDSAFEALELPETSARLAEIHGVPPEVLERQAEILRVAIDTLEDLPKSYRNIMDRVDDIQRASLWLLSGAETQAEFRRFFGTERFMQPTKSVAWAFFNRVFKRDMG